MRRVFVYLAASVVGFASWADAGDVEIRTGPWRAWLDSPGGDLPFGMELEHAGDTWRAWLINGSERIQVPNVILGDGAITFDMIHYDSKITAKPNAEGTRLDGEWTKTAGKDKVSRLGFHAVAGAAARFTPLAMSTADELRKIEGRWSVRFSSSDEPAVGVFKIESDGTVEGTFMTDTGDYRYLAGIYERRRLRLSCFDGAHAFLFDARLQKDGTLKGDFWSRDVWHETWTAERDSKARNPDGFNQVRARGAIRFDELVFPDLEGKPRSLGDAEFDGKARIIEIFGTWCPNCHDASQLLNELHELYGRQGLSIVGLAFELTGDFKRDARQVRRYVQVHNVKYPILIAGVADKEKASAKFPFLESVRAFPTTVFTDSDGNILAVHSGFSGPATGEANRMMRLKFRSLIKQLIRKANEEGT
ncbi:MAG: TlpA disulfide reductase family protein [Phycisphaerae bacterium]